MDQSENLWLGLKQINDYLFVTTLILSYIELKSLTLSSNFKSFFPELDLLKLILFQTNLQLTRDKVENCSMYNWLNDTCATEAMQSPYTFLD